MVEMNSGQLLLQRQKASRIISVVFCFAYKIEALIEEKNLKPGIECPKHEKLFDFAYYDPFHIEYGRKEYSITDAERDEIEAHAEKCLHCKLAILEHKAEKCAQRYLETFYPTAAGVQEELISEGFPMEAMEEIEE